MRATRRGLFTALILLTAVAPALAQVPGEPSKGVPGPAGPGSGLPEATGGPDAFGYVYFDQAEPECSFNFVDISTTGTQVDWSGGASGGCPIPQDDCSSGPLALSAPIDIYGTVYNSLVLAVNGYISTDGTDQGPDLSNDCPIPTTPSTGGGARLYPLHDDLTAVPFTGAGFVEYFATCPVPNDRCDVEDCTIFMWDDVALFADQSVSFDLEVVVYHQTNDITYQIGPGNPQTGSSSTTGLQNEPPPTIALQYACNSGGSVPDNTAVCIQHPNDPPPICLGGNNTLAVPTMSRTGIVILVLLIAGAGVFLVRRLF